MCAKAVADLHHVLRQADTRTQAGQGAFSSKTRNKQSKQSHKRHNTAQHNTTQTKPNQNQPTNNPNTNNQKQHQSTTRRHKTRRKTPRYHTKPNNRCIVAYRLCALRIVTVMSMLSLITTNVDSVELRSLMPRCCVLPGPGSHACFLIAFTRNTSIWLRPQGKTYDISSSDEFLLRPTRKNKHILKQMEERIPSNERQ